MRHYVLLAFVIGSFATGAATAGTLSYTDGQGRWTSTLCSRPARPDALPRNPDEAADDLNARIGAYNVYAEQTQAYLDCLSKEAERDAQGAQYVLHEAVSRLQQAATKDLNTIHNSLQHNKKNGSNPFADLYK